jgi:hypothetical protein
MSKKTSVNVIDAIIRNDASLLSVREKKAYSGALELDVAQVDNLEKTDRLLYLALKSKASAERPNPKTAQERISIYIEIANEYFQGNIVKKNKAEGVLFMAKAAYKLAEEYPGLLPEVTKTFKPTFGSRDKQPKKAAVEESANKGQFGDWIMFKNPKNQVTTRHSLQPNIPRVVTPTPPSENSASHDSNTDASQVVKLNGDSQAELMSNNKANNVVADNVINEIYATEKTFQNNMITLNNILNDPQLPDKIKDLKQEEILMIERYKKTLNDLVATFAGAAFVSPTNLSENQSLDDRLTTLQNVIHDEKLDAQLSAMESLAIQQAAIQPILAKIEWGDKTSNLGPCAASLEPFQRLTRYVMLFNELEKQLKTKNSKGEREETEASKQIHSTKIKFQEIAKNLNEKVRVQELLSTLSDKHSTPKSDKFQSFLNYQFQNQSEKSDARNETILKTFLTGTNPKLFSIDNGNLVINIKSKNLDSIKNALNIGEDQKINPEHFNADALVKLYRRDNNPTWLILASTKPIDENFSSQDKMRIYELLVQAYKKEELGNKNKSTNAMAVIKAAHQLAQEDPSAIDAFNKAFGTGTTLYTWLKKKGLDMPLDAVDDNNLDSLTQAATKGTGPVTLSEPESMESKTLGNDHSSHPTELQVNNVDSSSYYPNNADEGASSATSESASASASASGSASASTKYKQQMLELKGAEGPNTNSQESESDNSSGLTQTTRN